MLRDMANSTKNDQIQLRVSTKKKSLIMRAARRAGLSMSEYIMAKLLPGNMRKFEALMKALSKGAHQSYLLAELNDFLNHLLPQAFIEAVAQAPSVKLSIYQQNYVAAMIELAAHKKLVNAPAWVKEIPPLEQPVFGSDLKGLRLHLLLSSPPPFRRRNIFIDSSLGDRV